VCGAIRAFPEIIAVTKGVFAYGSIGRKGSHHHGIDIRHGA